MEKREFRFRQEFPELKNNRVGRIIISLTERFEFFNDRFEECSNIWVDKIMSNSTMASLENNFICGFEKPIIPDSIRDRWENLIKRFNRSKTS
ncbi:MAG: hypothetical protein Q7R43_05775 [Candidatus Daviesbacteria bacterium]|nr:hypothetical protein [Candidatus Daviesbacteria bacterium]